MPRRACSVAATTGCALCLWWFMSVWSQEKVCAVDVDGSRIEVSRPLPQQVIIKVFSTNGNVRATLDFDADDALLFLEYALHALQKAAKEIKEIE
jgi:hypothetical protein